MVATAAVLESTTADSASARWSQDTALSRSPYQISLLGQVAPDWEMVRPLSVIIEQSEDQSYVASDDVFMMYGVGEELVAAVVDYVSVLTEYYSVLSSHNDEPSVELFRYLQSYLQPIHR